MHQDSSDLRSLILIRVIPKEHTHRLCWEIYGCVPLKWPGSGSMIRDDLDHGRWNKPMNPLWTRIHRFIWSTMIRVISDHMKRFLLHHEVAGGRGEGQMSNSWRWLKECTSCPHKSIRVIIKRLKLDQVWEQRTKIRILLFSSQHNFKLMSLKHL